MYVVDHQPELEVPQGWMQQGLDAASSSRCSRAPIAKTASDYPAQGEPVQWLDATHSDKSGSSRYMGRQTPEWLQQKAVGPERKPKSEKECAEMIKRLTRLREHIKNFKKGTASMSKWLSSCMTPRRSRGRCALF